MKNLKQILQEIGEYQEPPVQRPVVPPKPDPAPPKRSMTVKEVWDNPGTFFGAWAKWSGMKTWNAMKGLWNGK